MAFFGPAKAKLLKGQINYLAGDLKVLLFGSGSPTTSWEFLSDIPTANQIAISATNLASTTLATNGVINSANFQYVFDAADMAFATVPVGTSISYVIIFRDTGTPSTSTLLNYFSSFYTPVGVGLTVTWSDTASTRVFSLTNNGNSSHVMYNIARKAMLDGNLDIPAIAANLKVALVDTGTIAFSDAHQYYSDISSGVVATAAMTGVTIGAATGVLDASDTFFPSLTGATIEQVVIYHDTGTPSTSMLLFSLTSGVGTYTPNGLTSAVVWNSAGIFSLA